MMKSIFLIILFYVSLQVLNCQTPVVMSTQPGLTYNETFADIANWTFNTTTNDGTLTNGIGASAWRGIDVLTTTPTIPNATRITTFSNFFQTPSSSGGVPIFSGGLYKGIQSIFMLSTGPNNNTSSVAFDFFMDFTGMNAGTLSFDWASLNNNSGNRASSLRVYASTDGIGYTEITNAQVLNFVNFSPTNGSIVNVALPASLSGSATARLRFYYHNGTGGTTGSRPRINIDNVKVTALPTTPCTAPTAQASNFRTTNVLFNTISLAFTAANPAPQNYLVVMSKNNLLSADPTSFTSYTIGDNLGDGTVVAITSDTVATISSLTNSTTYYFFVFAMNNVCTGGPLYNLVNPLTGFATTLAGQLPCTAPLNQPTNIVFSNITTTSIAGSFTPINNADEYLIIRSTSANFTGTLNNGTFYNGGNFLGNGSVVTRTAGTSFQSNNLNSGVTYFFFVFALNSQFCNNPPAYNTQNPLTASATTLVLPNCVTPANQPTQLELSADNTSVSGYFQAPSTTADNFIVLRSNNATLNSLPANGTNYTIGTNIGAATVVAKGAATAFIDYGLLPNTTYYYFVMALNSTCVGITPTYLTQNPLTNLIQTTSIATSKYYYGNLHAHSSYSDGNKDSATAIPSNNYAYAKNSLCMDFLGISDHNHRLAGMQLSNYSLGLNQAQAATTNNFLALYGMEYGVISNGGHVLIYGSNDLIGWEQGNYNTFVGLSDYVGTPETNGSTGLFRTINNMNNSGSNVFSSLAHPDFSDYNNLLNRPYNASADSAIVGSAVASGPAFSTTTSYDDPPSSFGHLDYYIRMLSKGYHLGPFMDHDTHYTNFGRTNNNRLAVIAPSLSQSDFFAAIQSKSFYATEDCDTRVNFAINNNKMGSTVTSSNSPAISIYVDDPTNTTAVVPNIKLMSGVVGSGILPVQIASANGNTLFYTDILLRNNLSAYYYVDITIGGNRTVTSPIWYNKTTPLPLKFVAFELNENMGGDKKINIVSNWITSNEINVSHYNILSSSDGRTFEKIGLVKATNKALNEYTFADDLSNTNPLKTLYYKIEGVDKDGEKTNSSIKKIAITNYKENTNFLIYPNPSKDLVNIDCTSGLIYRIEVIDMMGKVLSTVKVNNQKSSQVKINDLNSGLYFIKITTNTNSNFTQKILVN
jgi:trimeric autotransporter adhesin